MKKMLSILLGVVLVFTIFPAFAFAAEAQGSKQGENLAVTYNTNGGAASVMSEEVAQGSTITLPNASKDGYAFDGWQVGSDPTLYAAGSSYKPESDVTFNAQWTPVQAPGAGSGDDPGAVPGAIMIDPPKATIEETETPLAAPEKPVVFIPPDRPPLASFATWALLNFLLTIVTALIMAFLLIAFFRTRKDETARGEKGSDLRQGLRLTSIAATAAAAILFFATQDMSLPVAMADRYTGWHIVIAAASAVLAILCMKQAADADAQEA